MIIRIQKLTHLDYGDTLYSEYRVYLCDHNGHHLAILQRGHESCATWSKASALAHAKYDLSEKHGMGWTLGDDLPDERIDMNPRGTI